LLEWLKRAERRRTVVLAVDVSQLRSLHLERKIAQDKAPRRKDEVAALTAGALESARVNST
jgi:hypothetical protein